MNGIQGTDRFYRKGASDVGKDRLRDTHNMTTPGKSLQGEEGRSLLLNGDPSQEPSAKKCTGGFGHGEGGRYPLSLGTY